ncbi:hypothetical protein STENM223S_02232 [Streptomyces tendae]
MMAANQPIVATLRRVAARHGDGVTAAQVALAWVLAQGRHVVPVPGTKQERWVTQNAGATRGAADRAGSGGAGDAAAGAGVVGVTRAAPRARSCRVRDPAIGNSGSPCGV